MSDSEQPALFDAGEPATREPWPVVLPTEEERARMREERRQAASLAMLEKFFAGGVRVVDVAKK